jgi:hypothetical protein
MDRRGFLGLATGSIWGRGADAEQVMAPGGGRVTHSVTTYLANNAVYNVRDFGARADGGDDGPAIRRALDAAGPDGGTLLFPPGTYSYERSPNFAQNNLEILGRGKVLLRHTGEGVGFVVDGWLKKFGRRVWNMRIENLMLEGNPRTSVGFLFRAVHHGHFSRLRVTGGAPEGEGFRTEFFIANYCESWCVTGSEPFVGSLPATGITLTSLPAPKENLSTVDCTLTNFIVEGCARVGVHLDRAQHNLIRGGTFEDNHTGTGLLLGENASGNVVDGVFFESNLLHIDCRGPQNQFLGLSAAKGVCRYHVEGNFSRLLGGRFGDLAIDPGVRDVKLVGVAAARIVDRGLRTQRLGCHDLGADLPLSDHDGTPMLATGWIAPALDGCVDAGGDGAPAGFRREADGRIRLRGRLTRGPGKGGRRAPLLLFTLPATHRPRHRHRLPVLAGGKLGIVEVEPEGRVVLAKGSTSEIVLDGLVLAEDAGEG